MKHVVHHDLGTEKARKVAEAAFAAYTEKFSRYQPRVHWVTENQAEISFSVKGLALSGRMSVLPAAIEMDLDVPLLLRPFKGQALGVIEREILEWVAKAKQGTL